MVRHPVHFEIPADDPERAIRFYEQLFGWHAAQFDAAAESWMLSSGESGDAALPRSHVIRVSSIEEYALKAEQMGGEVVRPKRALAGRGWVAYCRDPDGNIFAIFEADVAAK